MRNKALAVAVLCLIGGVLAGSGLSAFAVNLRSQPEGDAGQHATRIRSYTVALSIQAGGKEKEAIIIPKVEGPNGFIITDILTTVSSVQDVQLIVDSGQASPLKINVALSGEGGTGSCISLASGIPVPAGAKVAVRSDIGEPTVTLCGYEY